MAKVAKLSVVLDFDAGTFTAKAKNAAGAVSTLQQSITKMGSTLDKAERGINGFGAQMRDLVLTVSHLRGAMFTIHSVTTAWATKIIQANAEMEKLTQLMKGFSTASTDAARTADANKSVGWLRQMAKTAPFDIATLSNAFVKFRAGGIDPTNGSLKALTDSVAAFGGNSDQFGRAAIAIQQMAGKGVVSMEELRQQLGEAVPNAINLMARGMGMSMSEMVKKVSLGMVEAKSALAKMFDEMERTFGGSAQQMMRTFNGQFALFKTNVNELITTSAGMQSFFAAVKDGLQAVNLLLADPIVAKWANDLGQGLTSVVNAGVTLLGWTIDYRNELTKLAQLLTAVFVGRTIVNGVLALAGVIQGAGITAMRGLQAATMAYWSAATAASAAMNSNTWAAYRLAQGAGVAAFAVRGLGAALTTVLGPIGMVVGALYLLADAAGLFGGSADKAAQNIAEGILTKKDVDTVKTRVADLRANITDAEKELERLKKNPNARRSDIEAWEKTIAENRAELAKMDEALTSGVNQLTDRAATQVSLKAQGLLGDKLNSVQVQYRKDIEAIEEKFKGKKEGSAEQKAVKEEQLALIKSYNAERLKIMDEAIAEQKAKLNSQNAEERKAAEKLYTDLSQQREQLGQTLAAQDQRFAAGNVYMDGDGNGAGKLDAAGQKIATMAGRLADLRAELAGGEGELAKLNAQIAEGAFKSSTPAQIARMRELAKATDETSAALKRQEAIKQAHDQAWGQITDKWMDAAGKAELVYDALARGDAEIDPKGLRSLIVTLEQAKDKLKEGSHEATEAIDRINNTIANVRFANIGEEAIGWAAKTKEINASLATDQRAARTAAYNLEVEQARKLLENAQLTGERRKMIEENLEAYLAALKAKNIRENESSIAKLAREWGNVTQQMSDAGGTWLNGMTNALTEFVTKGKTDFAGLATSIISDMIEIQMQAKVAGPLAGLLEQGVSYVGGLIGGAGASSTPAPAPAVKPNYQLIKGFHRGGIGGGTPTFTRMMPSSLFETAERFHTGRAPNLKPGEVPAVIRDDEGVFTPEQMKALGRGSQSAGNVQINLINQSGHDVEAEQQGGPRFDGEKMILDVVMKAMSKPGAFRNSVKGAAS